MSRVMEGNSLALSHESFRRFADCVTQRLGIKMPEGKQSMLQSRLQRRQRELRLDSIEAYEAYLFALPDEHEEWTQFVNCVTTNKTDFFREPQHFQWLVTRALPEMGPGAGGGAWECRVWCAGCSSGEEAYTLAMNLAEYEERHRGFTYSITATDISTRVLDHARRGIYEEGRVDPIAPELRRKYLLRSRDAQRGEVRVAASLRSRVRFGRLNFMDEAYGLSGNFDIIFFRNVMIYFDKPTQEAVLNRMCRHLAPGGHLFVGHSESLTGLRVPLRSIGSSIYRKA